MSTWTSSALLCLGLLGGCAELPKAMAFLPSSAEATRGAKDAPLTEARLAGGRVTLRAPAGYCIDRKSLRSGLTGGFALLSPCVSPVGAGVGSAGLLTATVMPGGAITAPPSARALADASPTARLLRDLSASGLTLALIEDPQAPPLPQLSAQHWRGAFLIEGHFVGLALYAPPQSANLHSAGADTLTDMARRSRVATPPEAVPSARTAGPRPQPRPPKLARPRSPANAASLANPEAAPRKPLFATLLNLLN